MSKSKAKKQVKMFAQSHGISVSGKDGIPLLVKGNWLYCADDWIDAYDYLSKARQAYIDRSITLPWQL